MVGAYGTSDPQIVSDDPQAEATQQSDFTIQRCAAGPRKRIHPELDESSSTLALPSLSPSPSPPPNTPPEGNHTPRPLNQVRPSSTTRPASKRHKKSVPCASTYDQERVKDTSNLCHVHKLTTRRGLKAQERAKGTRNMYHVHQLMTRRGLKAQEIYAMYIN